MSTATFEKVREIIVEKLGVSADEVKPESQFQDDLGADSLSIAELMMEFEEKFGLASIPDEDAQQIRTVQDAVTYLDSRCG